MRVMSEISEDVLKRRSLNAELAQAIQELTANLLRITRGAGKASEIGRQAQAVMNVIDAHKEMLGYFPFAADVSKYLDVWTSFNDRADLGQDEYYRREEEDQLLRAALQLVASRMLGQPMQEGTAQRDLYTSIDRINERANERRKKVEAERRAASKIMSGRRGRKTKPDTDPWPVK